MKTHQQSKTRLYQTWKNLKNRVNGKCCKKDHKYYLLKKVTLCEAWEFSFENFSNWAMSSGYKEGLTIDRIDGTKGYCPENCRWATRLEQLNNRSNVIKYQFGDELLSLKEISSRVEIQYITLRARILEQGMSLNDAISLPVKKRGPYKKLP